MAGPRASEPGQWQERLRALVQGAIEKPPAFGQILQHGLQALAILAAQAGRRGGRARSGIDRTGAPSPVVVVRGGALVGCGRLVRQVSILRGRRARLRSARLPDALHEAHTLLAQQALDAADSVALAVEQMPHAT